MTIMKLSAGTSAERVQDAIAAQERSHKWLADKTGIALSTLRRRLVSGNEFTLNELLAISMALGVHPSELLPPQFSDECLHDTE